MRLNANNSQHSTETCSRCTNPSPCDVAKKHSQIPLYSPRTPQLRPHLKQRHCCSGTIIALHHNTAVAHAQPRHTNTSTSGVEHERTSGPGASRPSARRHRFATSSASANYNLRNGKQYSASHKKTSTPHLGYTKSQHTTYVHNPPPQNSLEVSFYFLSGSEYLLRIALYRENLENSSASLITFRPRATDLLISSSEESSAFLCRASRTFSLNQASPDGCRRAASTALLQKFLTKGCIPERIRRQVLLLCDRAVAVKRKERNGGGG